MPELPGPQPVESREAYDRHVAEYKDAQSRGSNLPEVAYAQPGQVFTPDQLPDPTINLRAGFAPQELAGVWVFPKEEALAHPSGPELDDPARLGKGNEYKLAAEFAAKNAESYDEQKKLSELSAPERDQLEEGDRKSDSGPAPKSDSGPAHQAASADGPAHEAGSAKPAVKPTKS